MGFLQSMQKDIRCHNSSPQFPITYFVFLEGKKMLLEQFQQVGTVKPFKRIIRDGLRFQRSNIKEARMKTQDNTSCDW